MHYVYILYSDFLDRYYIGESVDPNERVIQHNTSFFAGASTKTAHDWRILMIIPVCNRNEARIVEQYIKGMKSREFLKNLTSSKTYYSNFKELVLTKFSITIPD